MNKEAENLIKIEEFIADTMTINPVNGKIIETVRKEILKRNDKLREAMMYGGLLFKYDKFLAFGLFSRKDYVTIEIGNGQLINDQFNHLEGIGTKEGRRHIKLFTMDDIEKKHLIYYLEEAIKNLH